MVAQCDSMAEDTALRMSTPNSPVMRPHKSATYGPVCAFKPGQTRAKPRKLRGRLRRNRAGTKPKKILRTSQAKPGPNQAKPGRNEADSEDVSSETGPKPGQTRQILRTSQAKPGPNQAKPKPNQANCEDLSSETGPKPGQTRGQTKQIRRMS